jgi:hypothetical protein
MSGAAPRRLKPLVFAVLAGTIALLMSWAAAEGMMRLKNAPMKDYKAVAVGASTLAEFIYFEF